MQNLIIKQDNEEWNLLALPGKLEGAWITAEELGKHLGYEEPRKAVMKIYERYSQDFANKVDSIVVKLTTDSMTIDGKRNVRNTTVFSERGALKIIRHSETPKADEIMDHVFDVFLAARKETIAEDYLKQRLIETMILPAPREWQKTFPDAFAQGAFIMYGLGTYKAGDSSLALSKFYWTYVYCAAPEGIAEILLEENPGGRGGRKWKHHQLLTDDGRAWLVRHIGEVATLMRCSHYNITLFKQLFKTAFPKTRSLDFFTSGLAELEKIDVEHTKQLLFEF